MSACARSLSQLLYAPVFLCGFVAAALWLVGVVRAPLPWLLALLGLALVCSFAAEALMPYDPDWNRSHGDRRRDVAHALVNEGLNVLSIAAVPLVAALIPGPGLWPTQLPLAVQVLAAIVVADCGITLAHWLSHRWPPLWRLHAVHHSVTRMYGLNGLMKHPLHQGVEAVAGTLPLLACGMPTDVAAVLAFAVSVQLLLQHANVDMRPGPLRAVFAWAPLHRFHHIKYGAAGDVNFGLFLTLWDRLLGTAFDRPQYRIGSGDLGIGAWPDYPRRYLQQLAEPFRARPEHGAVPVPAALRRG